MKNNNLKSRRNFLKLLSVPIIFYYSPFSFLKISRSNNQHMNYVIKDGWILKKEDF